MDINKRLQAKKELENMMIISRKEADKLLDRLVLEVKIKYEKHSRLPL